MIEIVSPTRCTGCNICVQVCPTQVFDAVPGGLPAIARQNDCQTCFMCELYCPEDALYVAPQVTPAGTLDEAALADAGTLGSYRRAVGWSVRNGSTAGLDQSYHLLGTVR